MHSTKKVLKNTIFLYIKMLFSIFVALFSTRLVLNAMGVSDYGVYTLVAGVIALLSFLNAAMTVSTQRFMSFYLGAGLQEKIQSVFQASIILHLLLGIIIVFFLEIIGYFLFDGFLNINPDRVVAAKTVYHFMVISTFFTINAIPYDSTINAHENMLFDAVVGVIESSLKFGIAIWLTFSDSDRLVMYGLLIALLTILIRIIKSVYCNKKYSECKFSLSIKIDYPLLKEMFSFASWNLFGVLAGMGKNQGVAIMINIFYGTVVNAAYGIANQVAGQLLSFSTMMLKAVNPQIMKSEGTNDRQRMLKLAMMTSKFSFFLMSFFVIPVIFEMPNLLELWLKEVPEYTVIFCDLILISILVNQLTIGLQSAFQATGNIKRYQFIIGSLLLLNLPIGYVLLKQGFPVYYVLISFIFIELLASFFRLILLKRIAGLSIQEYFKRVILLEFFPVLASILVCYLIVSNVDFSFRFILTGIVSGLVLIIAIFYTGLYHDEKTIVLQLVDNIMNRIKKNEE